MYRHTGYRSKRDGQLALQHHNVFRPHTARMERVLRDLQYLQSSVSIRLDCIRLQTADCSPAVQNAYNNADKFQDLPKLPA